MARGRPRKNKTQEIIRIWRVLKSNPNIYIKEIAREIDLHPEQVRRIIDGELSRLVESKSFGELKLRFILIKPKFQNIDENGLAKFLELKI